MSYPIPLLFNICAVCGVVPEPANGSNTNSNSLKFEEWVELLFLQDDGEITLMNNLYYNNKKLENTDFGTSQGSYRFVKIWKQDGGVVEINV